MRRRSGRHAGGSICAWAAFLALGAVAPSVQALQQPNFTTIPVINASVTICSDRNVQVCLDAEEGGQTISALNHAQVTPETYNPNCNLTFKVLARGAGYLNTFGWYNVVPDPNVPGGTLKPPDADLHAFLLCTDGPGVTKTLDIRSDPGYHGGLIGFFMATPEGATGNCPTFNATGGPLFPTVGKVYYSERKFNPDNIGPASWIHLITYQSVAHQDSFYFAWEDKLSGGDNDFDDLLTRVEGIRCSGGGAPCQTGQPGICNEGVEQCFQGTLQCVQQFSPAPEQCNGLDDNCDAAVDEGELCPASEVCDRGKCVPRCGSSEFLCSAGLLCSDKGLCVDALCETVTCQAEQICVAGNCVGACDGVTCPWGEVCRNGRCLDPCGTVVCDQGFACDKGICTQCSCSSCGAGLICVQEKCIDAACAGIGCGPGSHCAGGQCVDDCAGAVCPPGESCQTGSCVADPNAGDAGSSGGAGGSFAFDGGIGAVPGSGGAGAGAGAGAAPASGGSAGTSHARGSTAAKDESGCLCRHRGSTSASGAAAFAALGLALGAAARRRRRRSRVRVSRLRKRRCSGAPGSSGRRSRPAPG